MSESPATLEVRDLSVLAHGKPLVRRASFTVQAGEIIDAGFLRIDYTPDELIKTIFTGAATLRLSVQPTSDVRLAELRKVIPRVMARAKKSHMVLLGSPVKKVKRKGLLD